MPTMEELNAIYHKLQKARKQIQELNALDTSRDCIVAIGGIAKSVNPVLAKSLRDSVITYCYAEIEQYEEYLKKHGIAP